MIRHRLHIITTGAQELDQVASILRNCPLELLDSIHIREKHRTARELLQWCTALRALLPGQVSLRLNDRLDVAAAIRTDSVQLAYHSLPPEMARQILPAGLRICCSVHSPEEARQAEAAGADELLFGHIYATDSKAGVVPRGLEALRGVVSAVRIPVTAIGGIRPEHVPDVLDAGAEGIAVLSSVLLHKDPAGQIRAYRAALEQAGGS
ncbi:thiamine phosphate synthase [Paenibacillus sp. y28]|uniref:thiamine phosphate synthase n=1 Tax=Paenibacillus sp. y28 TaxID=3129110 RepID=UPI00301A0F3B